MTPIGNLVFRFEKVDSTNVTAIDLLRRNEIGHGAVIVAESQLAGKGQRGNNWLSEKGQNLTASYVIQPLELLATKQFQISVVAALAVQQLIRKVLEQNYCSDHVTIKWPNDILIGEKKVAGILIENSVQGDRISSSIIGIGINVNQTHFKDLPHACSLRMFLNDTLEIDNLLVELSKNLNSFFTLMENGNGDFGLELFREHLFRLHHWENLEINGDKNEYRILGVEKDGRLKIEDRKFRTLSVMHHEVKWVKFG